MAMCLITTVIIVFAFILLSTATAANAAFSPDDLEVFYKRIASVTDATRAEFVVYSHPAMDVVGLPSSFAINSNGDASLRSVKFVSKQPFVRWSTAKCPVTAYITMQLASSVGAGSGGTPSANTGGSHSFNDRFTSLVTQKSLACNPANLTVTFQFDPFYEAREPSGDNVTVAFHPQMFAGDAVPFDQQSQPVWIFIQLSDRTIKSAVAEWVWTAAYAIASAATLLGAFLAGLPMLLTVVPRAKYLRSLATCSFLRDYEVDPIQYWMRAPMGTSPYKFYVGCSVLNVLTIFLLVGLQLLYLRHKASQHKHWGKEFVAVAGRSSSNKKGGNNSRGKAARAATTTVAGRAVVRTQTKNGEILRRLVWDSDFPSLFFLGFALFMQVSVRSLIIISWHSEHLIARVFSAVLYVFWLSVTVFLLVMLVFRFCVQWTDEADVVKGTADSFFYGRGYWIEPKQDEEQEGGRSGSANANDSNLAKDPISGEVLVGGRHEGTTDDSNNKRIMMRKVKHWSKGLLAWFTVPYSYCHRFSILFQHYRHGRHWFFLIEILCSIFLGLLEAVRTDNGCAVIAELTIAVGVVYGALIFLLRPFIAPIDQICFGSGAVVYTVSAMFLTVFHELPSQRWAETFASSLVVGWMVVMPCLRLAVIVRMKLEVWDVRPAEKFGDVRAKVSAWIIRRRFTSKEQQKRREKHAAKKAKRRTRRQERIQQLRNQLLIMPGIATATATNADGSSSGGCNELLQRLVDPSADPFHRFHPHGDSDDDSQSSCSCSSCRSSSSSSDASSDSDTRSSNNNNNNNNGRN